MESWCHASEGRGFMIPDEMDLPNDPYARNRRALAGWDRGFVDSREFLVPSCSELPKNPVYNDNTSIMMHRYSGLGVDSGRNVGAYASMIPSNSSMGSVSNRSNSIMGSSSQDSPPSDLKQGSIADHREAQNGNLLRDRPVFSSVSPTIQAKRARIVSIRSQTPFCQVYGCNKDLSSSKDYHRRHKVCELHSKTPKVIVNGIEQRFCQQCSRFHLLVEFDNGKRSCRKRLAGHNERRRKPQFVALPGRRHELLQSYKERCELANWHRHVKLEEESTHNPPTVTALTRASTLHLHGDRIPNTFRISVSPTEDLTTYNTASAAYDFTGMAQSSCALSLLSSELHDSSHLTRNMMVRSLCSHSNPNCRIVGTSDKLSVKHSFEKYAPNGSHWSKANSNQLKQMGSSVVAGAGHRTDLRAKVDGALVVESDLSNATVRLSSEEVPTVGLLQLSSHLQRVEQQRTFMQVKNENDDLCSFHATY